MKCKSVLALGGAMLLSLQISFGQITENPKVDEQSAKYVKIKRVELTDKYTIIHLQFTEQNLPAELQKIPDMQRQPDMKLPFNIPNQIPQGSTIWLDPETRLYKPGEIEKKFKFVKAENIPTNEKRKKVEEGEVVDFVAYFERLTPGIEEFDFYEGRSTGQLQSWNFYGIHIKNPKNGIAKATKPAAKTVKPAPKEQAAATPPPAKPVEEDETKGVAVFKGTVYNAKTKQPITAELSYVENGDSMQIKSGSGKYRLGLDPAGKYDLKVTAKGFYGSTLAFAPADSAGKSAFNHDFYLNPLAVGETINMPNLYFETSKYTLLPESYPELNKLADIMRDNKQIRIRIEGHTDNVGDFDKNLELSRKRAESVQAYLVEKGIEADRIEAKGYGATRPLSQGSAEERKKNRRVEFVVLEV